MMKYGTSVYVTGGFYQGQTGFVINAYSTNTPRKDGDGWVHNYKLRLDTGDTTDWISESRLHALEDTEEDGAA